MIPDLSKLAVTGAPKRKTPPSTPPQGGDTDEDDCPAPASPQAAGPDLSNLGLFEATQKYLQYKRNLRLNQTYATAVMGHLETMLTVLNNYKAKDFKLPAEQEAQAEKMRTDTAMIISTMQSIMSTCVVSPG